MPEIAGKPEEGLPPGREAVERASGKALPA